MITIPIKSINSTESDKAFMECGAAISRGTMEQFVNSFQQSARRWETIVYPALFAFVVLAGYGFFLIYNLTSDMSKMADSMDSNMENHMETMSNSIVSMSEQILIMSNTMSQISVKLNSLQPMLQYVSTMDESINSMTQSMRNMDKMMTHMDSSMAQMNNSIGSMDISIESMDSSIATIDKSVRVMTAATDQLRRDFSYMNQSISSFSRPASFVNTFMPW